jgi:hypothetical protein
MTEPAPLTLDEDTIDEIRRAAHREGKSVREFIRDRARGREDPRAFMENIARQRLQTGPPKSIEEQMQSFFQMKMMREFMGNGGGHSSLDSRDVADLVRDELDRRESRKGGGGSAGPGGSIREALMPIVEMKLMMKLVGDEKDPMMQQLVQTMEKDLRDQMLALGKSNEEMRNELRAKELEDERERHALELEAMKQEIGDLRATIGNQPPPPKPPGFGETVSSYVGELSKAQESLVKLRSVLGPTGTEGPKGGVDLDTIEKGLNIASDMISKNLTAAAQYQQITQGKAPAQLHTPGGPPQPPPQPNYTGTPPVAAPPAPVPRTAVPAPQAPPPAPETPTPRAAAATSPVAPRIPGAVYIDPASGDPISEALFFEKYGRVIEANPAAMEVHAGPPPRSRPASGEIPAAI